MGAGRRGPAAPGAAAVGQRQQQQRRARCATSLARAVGAPAGCACSSLLVCPDCVAANRCRRAAQEDWVERPAGSGCWKQPHGCYQRIIDASRNVVDLAAQPGLVLSQSSSVPEVDPGQARQPTSASAG